MVSDYLVLTDLNFNSDKEVEQDEEEEELKPLINDESHEEQQSLDSPKVKFEHETENQATEQFPLESRLKYVRVSCPLYFTFTSLLGR